MLLPLALLDKRLPPSPVLERAKQEWPAGIPITREAADCGKKLGLHAFGIFHILSKARRRAFLKALYKSEDEHRDALAVDADASKIIMIMKYLQLVWEDCIPYLLALVEQEVKEYNETSKQKD